jgi:hypothetical protein
MAAAAAEGLQGCLFIDELDDCFHTLVNPFPLFRSDGCECGGS